MVLIDRLGHEDVFDWDFGVEGRKGRDHCFLLSRSAPMHSFFWLLVILEPNFGQFLIQEKS